MKSESTYCLHPFGYKRLQTRKVPVGNAFIGGDSHILLQSMTTTDTMDVEATVNQSIRMIQAGCELVRITAPSKKEAEKLNDIRQILTKQGFDTPLVADIHFTPNAAEIAADYVEKIRVNPGNYADKKKFEHLEYTDEAYQDELKRIETRFTPLVLKCKKLGRSMRIGTNHGSLSDRILSRYGDTPKGMVESAMEFIRICAQLGYHDLVISMKASNAQVMVQAYRLLMITMHDSDMNYPVHLGVTEAGDGEDGRIKSAIGIGALLEDGIGDTIRVSLTEEPEAEIPVAKKLAERYRDRKEQIGRTDLRLGYDPFSYSRRHSSEVAGIAGKNVPVVIADLSQKPKISPASFFGAGYSYSVPLDKWNIGDMAADFIYIGKNSVDFAIPGTLRLIQGFKTWKENPTRTRHFPMFEFKEWMSAQKKDPHPELNFVALNLNQLESAKSMITEVSENVVLILTSDKDHSTSDFRTGLSILLEERITVPVILKRSYNDCDLETFQLFSATDCGVMFLDGFGDGIWLEGNGIPLISETQTAFGILQATRTRISKTEYISCPSCGRTLFDLQETTAKIRARTSHLKGVKIGIMGCIVNGPGEMADADYGYVGTGPGKITLYKEKEVVEKNIPEEKAVDALIDLIKSHGDWVEVKEMTYS
jgi:(E)-4-hydroxy-3-methylbut-2-enyl-diphosphate synthase